MSADQIKRSTLKRFADILTALEKGGRWQVHYLMDDGRNYGVLTGIPRNVVEPQHDGIAIYWSDRSRLWLTTIQGFEAWIPLGEIEDIVPFD